MADVTAPEPPQTAPPPPPDSYTFVTNVRSIGNCRSLTLAPGHQLRRANATEIEFINGFVVDKAKEIGIATPANAVLTEIVMRVERGELQPDPRHIKELRLN